MFNILQESMNARGLYWFKLGMNKLVDVTGSCQTDREHNDTKCWSPGKRLGRSLIHAGSALHHQPWATSALLTIFTTFPSPSAVGSWDWAAGQESLWPGLGCSACPLEGPCFPPGLHSFLWHPAAPLPATTPWWTHPGSPGGIYFQSGPKEQFPNRECLSQVPWFPKWARPEGEHHEVTCLHSSWGQSTQLANRPQGWNGETFLNPILSNMAGSSWEYFISRKTHKWSHVMLYYYDSLHWKRHKKHNTLADPIMQPMLLNTKLQTNHYTQS